MVVAVCYFPNNLLDLAGVGLQIFCWQCAEIIEHHLISTLLSFVARSAHCWQLGLQNKDAGQFHAAVVLFNQTAQSYQLRFHESQEDSGSSASAKRFSEARFKCFPQRALIFFQSSVTREEIFEMNDWVCMKEHFMKYTVLETTPQRAAINVQSGMEFENHLIARQM